MGWLIGMETVENALPGKVTWARHEIRARFAKAAKNAPSTENSKAKD